MSDKFKLNTLPKWLISTVAISILLLVILFALGAFTGGKIKPGNTAHSPQGLPANVETLKIESQMETNTLSWQGTVRSRMTVKITPKLNARIVDVLVHAGDRLKRGDVIARLDDRDLRAALDAANAAYSAVKAQMDHAKTEQRRAIDLYSKKATTRQNYDAVMSDLKVAEANASQAASAVQQKRVMLGENVLYAPFDGIVGERLQDPGDMGMISQAVITFLKPDDLRLEVAISSSCLSLLKSGMNVNVRIDALQKTLSGMVDEIAPEVDPEIRSQLIKIRLPHIPGLHQGQLAWLELACQSEQQTLLIPATAVIHYGQLQAVKVFEAGQIQIRHIRTGKQYGDNLEILSGLHEGETILIEGGLMP